MLQANAMETTVVAPRAAVAATNTRCFPLSTCLVIIALICDLCQHMLSATNFDIESQILLHNCSQLSILSALPDSPVWSSGSGAIKEIRLHEAEMKVGKTLSSWMVLNVFPGLIGTQMMITGRLIFAVMVGFAQSRP